MKDETPTPATTPPTIFTVTFKNNRVDRSRQVPPLTLFDSGALTVDSSTLRSSIHLHVRKYVRARRFYVQVGGLNVGRDELEGWIKEEGGREVGRFVVTVEKGEVRDESK